MLTFPHPFPPISSPHLPGPLTTFQDPLLKAGLNFWPPGPGDRAVRPPHVHAPAYLDQNWHKHILQCVCNSQRAAQGTCVGSLADLDQALRYLKQYLAAQFYVTPHTVMQLYQQGACCILQGSFKPWNLSPLTGDKPSPPDWVYLDLYQLYSRPRKVDQGQGSETSCPLLSFDPPPPVPPPALPFSSPLFLPLPPSTDLPVLGDMVDSLLAHGLGCTMLAVATRLCCAV